MHNKDIVHRDIKPENFLVGTGKRANVLYIVDYGLAKRFKDSSTEIHIKY
jgi:serine/threonine protein kinase